ncbi:restriction endonuclease subunit S [Nitrosopumilus sp. K4]|uniref:restriction endonuclease subunit S n=1 Tax=Nitrosopumilus sp. K4 TaxID=2795383 RepID=UPI001BA6A9E2|nr:restriction endonuclease subunit S [Nitrosopumilus sp. K4]QUC64161.1 restriction endonuclease subunit S [Nitrosopumilus sp. K4]
MKEVSLNDESLFKLSIGKRVLLSEVFQSTGKIPIYSANVFVPMGYKDTSNIKNFNNDYVLWGIDGNFEFNVKHKGEKFGNTDHCGVIEILDSNILPEYLVHQLEIKKYELGFDRTLRSSLSNMTVINVEIPVKATGEFDEDEQLRLVKKYNSLKKLKEQLRQQRDEFENALLEINDNYKKKSVEVSTLFDFPETNSGMTKRLCNDNKGKIPVYGCSKSGSMVLGHIKKLPNIKYYSDCLTWNRNGSVGKFFFREGVFSTNEDHRVLKIKKSLVGKIDPIYMKYVLEKEVRKLGYSFTKKLGKINLQSVVVDIPINNTGDYDIDKQEEIAEKYEKLYQMKSKVAQELHKLIDTVVKL